jgi:hypothetical protein
MAHSTWQRPEPGRLRVAAVVGAGSAKYPVWGDQGYRGRVELEELSCTRPFEKRAE